MSAYAGELAPSDLPPPILATRYTTGRISAYAGEFKSKRQFKLSGRQKSGYDFKFIRAVAQSGSALPWGGRGPGFKSRRPDNFPKENGGAPISSSRRRKRIGPGVGVRGPISRAKRNLIKPRSGIRDCVGVGPRGRISRRSDNFPRKMKGRHSTTNPQSKHGENEGS